MFDVSWGELVFVTGLGLFFIGKHDLPKASKVVGTYTGRVVGLLQGARARADRFAAQSELKHLQNELRSGLRELDIVKSELAVSLSPGRMIGRTLGAVTANANKQHWEFQSNKVPTPKQSKAVVANGESGSVNGISTSLNESAERWRAPLVSSQSVAAVAEMEWEKQGISFVSRFEKNNEILCVNDSGSNLIAEVIKQSLIFDQYDLVSMEQDLKLNEKIQRIEDMTLLSPKSDSSDTGVKR